MPLALFLMVGLVAIMGAYHALLGWVGREIPARARRAALARRHSRRVAAHRMVAQLVPHRFRLAGARLFADGQLARQASRPSSASSASGCSCCCSRAALVPLLLGDKRDAHRGCRAVSSSIWGVGLRAARRRMDRAVQPPDLRGRGAGRDPAGREVDRGEPRQPSLERLPGAHAPGAWRRDHRLAGIRDPGPG